MAKSSPLLDNYAIRWWKYRPYEIRGGCIAPRPGAVLKFYDPWKGDGSADLGTFLHRALNELLEIVPVGNEFAPSDDDVLAWSANYGPLGVLPHRIVYVRQQPCALTELDLDQLEENARRQGYKTEGRREETRSRLAGYSVSTLSFQGFWRKSKELPLFGRKPSDSPSAVVLRSDEPHGSSATLAIEALDHAFGPFFPELPRVNDWAPTYPEPDTTEFATAYFEPFEVWVHWARTLARAMDELTTTNDLPVWRTGATSLSWLAQSTVSVLYRQEHGQIQLVSRSPSLLSALATVAMQRMAAFSEPKRCKDPKCDRVFLPLNARAEYHSEACRFRLSKENVRARAKRKRKRSPQKRGKPSE